MNSPYPKEPKKIQDLKGFGPRSEEILAEVGILSVSDFMKIDPYKLYERLFGL